MPLYEYQCDACGNRFEVIQKFSDRPLEVCPRCGGAVRKLQSAPAFQFKGSGWYITDYARKDQSGSGETEKKVEKGDSAQPSSEKKADAPKTESTGEKATSAESKSAPKPEA